MLEINLRICTRSVLIYKELGETMLSIGNPKRKMTSMISFWKEFWTILCILAHIQFWSLGFVLCMFLKDHGSPSLYRDTRDLEIHGRRGSGFKQLYPWTPSCELFSMGDKSINGPFLICVSNLELKRIRFEGANCKSYTTSTWDLVSEFAIWNCSWGALLLLAGKLRQIWVLLEQIFASSLQSVSSNSFFVETSQWFSSIHLCDQCRRVWLLVVLIRCRLSVVVLRHWHVFR